MATVKYFYKSTELTNIFSMSFAKFAEKFPGVKGMKQDSFSMLVGNPATGFDGPFPVERRITYKSFASRHECNSKCMNGRHDGACECQCGGKNHGLGAFLNAA